MLLVILIKYFEKKIIFTVKMTTDQVDAAINLTNLVYDDHNKERSSWKLFGHEVSRSMSVFMFQCLIVFIIVICSMTQIMLATTCEETTVWVAILSSSVGYVLPAPKL